MQEQVTDKSIVISTKATKMTAEVFRQLLVLTIKKMREPPQGKQSVKSLAKQGAGLNNIEITNKNIKSFEKVARKYGVDFALKKDNGTPPRMHGRAVSKGNDQTKWLVFFKARDADALTSAFSEFTAKSIKKEIPRPSLLKQLNKFKELAKSLASNKVKKKTMGGHEL